MMSFRKQGNVFTTKTLFANIAIILHKLCIKSIKSLKAGVRAESADEHAQRQKATAQLQSGRV